MSIKGIELHSKIRIDEIIKAVRQCSGFFLYDVWAIATGRRDRLIISMILMMEITSKICQHDTKSSQLSGCVTAVIILLIKLTNFLAQINLIGSTGVNGSCSYVLVYGERGGAAAPPPNKWLLIEISH